MGFVPSTNSDFNAGSSFKPDMKTSEGLKAFAEKKGVEVSTKQKIVHGVETGMNALTWTARQVGVGIQKLQGREKIDNTLMPSDVIFGKAKSKGSLGADLKHQFTTFDGLLRFATDVFLDPTTYLTLGTGAATKVLTKEGAKVAVSKAGKEVLDDIAKEMIEKGVNRNLAMATAKKQVGLLASPTATTILQKGGLKNIERALTATGKEMTAQEVQNFIKSGGKDLVRKSAVRFAGKEVFELPKMGSIYEKTLKVADKIPAVKKLTPMIEGTRKTMGGLFSRDFELPETFIPTKQKYIDSYDNAAARTGAQVKSIFSETSITDEQASKMSRAIADDNIKSLPEHLQPLARRIKNVFKAIALEEERRGLLNDTLENYVPHIYKNREGAKNILTAIRAGQPSAILPFSKGRTLPDFDEAIRKGLEPIEDIRQLVYLRLMASEKAKLTQDFIREVFQKHGVVRDINIVKKSPPRFKEVIKTNKVPLGDGFVKFKTSKIEFTPMGKFIKNAKKANPAFAKQIINSKDALVPLSEAVTGIPDTLKSRNIYIPANIAEDIASMGKRMFEDESMNRFLRFYDNVHNFFKGSVTVTFPSFHIRNAISNTMQNFLDIGVQTYNPRVHKMAVDLLMGADGTFVNDLGEEYTYKELRRLMKSHGIFQDTLARTDVGRIAPSGISKFSLFEAGRKVGRAIENEARLVNFITNIRRGLDPEDAAARTKQFLFDYDNLSLFEKDILRRGIPFYCVPVSHEILTRNGWKFYNQLKKGEEVMTYNHKTENLEWQKLQKIALFDFSGILKKFERRGGSVLFTDDHRWPTVEVKTTVKGKKYGGKRRIKRAYELNTTDLIPLTGIYTEEKSILTPREAAILGWVISDGHFRWRKNYCEMVVYQSPKKHLSKVIELLGTKPRKPHPVSGVVCVPVGKEDVKKIVKVFKDKSSLMNIVGHLSYEAAFAMWEAMFLAEGFQDFNTMGFAQDPVKNKEVLDAFQILTLLIGKSGNISTKGLYVKTSKYLKVSEGIGEEFYSGKIWCPKTKNGTWVTRNKGFMMITGNTWTRKNIALQLKALGQQPGKQAAVAKMFNTLNDMFGYELTDEEKRYTPEYVRAGLNILLERQGDDRTFLVGFDLPLENFFEQIGGAADNPFRQALNQMSPYIKAPLEYGMETKVFGSKPISTDDSGVFAKNLPQPVKEWLEFTPIKGKTKQGEEYEYYKVNPEKKWIFQNVSAMGLVGRAVSPPTLDGLKSMYEFFDGKPMTMQRKGDIIRLFTGVTTKTHSLEGEKNRQEKQEFRRISDELERKGLVNQGEYTFERKNQ